MKLLFNDLSHLEKSNPPELFFFECLIQKGNKPMIIETLETGPLAVTCIIIGDDDTKSAVVVDPGGHVHDIKSILDKYSLNCELIINTHSHFDHVGGNKKLHDQTKAPIAIHSAETDLLIKTHKSAALFGMRADESPPATHILKDDEIIKISNIELEVRHTPGHSPGSVTIFCAKANIACVGDTIFQGSIGRTDLPGGSYERLLSSIKKRIFTLPKDCKLFPGHGPETIVEHEIKTNPFFN